MAAATPSVQRNGDTLAFAGALSREAVPVLWPQALRALEGTRRFDLSQVDAVDSAGLAMLVALAARMDDVHVEGAPRGMTELLAAYRLTPTLAFDDGR